MSYVEIPAQSIFEQMEEIGFSRFIHGNEIVYTREHNAYPGLFIILYTSIKEGETSARDCGKDAIRVVTLFKKGEKEYAIGKFAKIYRTGSVESVLDRIIGRCREAYHHCTLWAREKYMLPNLSKPSSKEEAIKAYDLLMGVKDNNKYLTYEQKNNITWRLNQINKEWGIG